MLQVDTVTKTYGGRTALREVSFGVGEGRITGFVGANGAGKTTTMRIILGVLSADSGTVSLGGATLTADDRRIFGYMPEERGLYPKMKVAEQITYFGRLHGMTARDLVAMRLSGELCSLESEEPVEKAVRLMSDHDFSQISITRDNRLVGSLNESTLYNELVRNSDVKSQPVETIMQPAFPFVDVSTPIDLLSTMITPQNPAVLVRDFKTDKTFIITRSDLMRVL